MELHEYPRPANDTGIGIHWVPGYAAAVGMAPIRDTWLPELRALGVKWVKVYNHDGAQDFVEVLLAEGFMPILRIYRPAPNPGRLGLREVVHIDSYVRLGVRYFEFNSEPDRESEWKGGRLPPNGLDLAAEDAIANMEVILERGGMPGVPAVSPGSTWDLVGKIVAKGRKDLFDGPVWQAVHNYARNRPLDYPYDIGNQEGAAYTERFYRTVAEEVWEENAWRGRSLAEVNRLRLDRCTPGATIKDDHACWLAYEHFDALNRHHLGRSIPILATESGYLTGEDSDARYPATTPNLHLAQSLEACRVLMGTSHRFPPAPDYFFCAAFMVIANTQLAGLNSWWERFAWYSARWPGGVLPIVKALRAEPKIVRKRQGTASSMPLITLRGTVLNARTQHTVILERNGLQVASAVLDTSSRYELPDLTPGAYVLRVEDTPVQEAVNLTPDQREMVVTLDVGAPAPEAASRSIVSGHVRGGAGAVVVLLRQADGEEWVTMARDDGGFRFIDLPAGGYSVRVTPEGSRVDNVELDGRNHAEVDLAVAGWGYTITQADPAVGVGAIRVRVKGERNVSVKAHTFGGSTEAVRVGKDANFGPDECQIAPLEAGLYMITVHGLYGVDGRPVEPEARVTVDKRGIPLLEFVYTDLSPAPAAASTIRGRVVGGAGDAASLAVRLIDSQARTQETAVQEDGAFEFAGLAAGLYTVELVGHEATARRTEIAVDGANEAEVQLVAPVPPRAAAPAAAGGGRSVISATARGAAGKVARLVDAVGNEQRQVVTPDDTVRFERLAAGTYTLRIEGGWEQGGLALDGRNGQDVHFSPLETVWEASVTNAGSMPGYSVVRVEVQGMKDVPVFIWKEDWDGMMRRTGTSPEHGPNALEFGPLGPGAYMVEPEGLGIWTTVELTGLEAVWVEFRAQKRPASPHSVRPLAAAALPEPAPAPAVQKRHYIWLGNMTASGQDLIALVAYAGRTRAQAGMSLDEALAAEVVTILGGDDENTLLAEQLAAAGVEVNRVASVAELLDTAPATA